MFHDANEYDIRADEAERLALTTSDYVLREEVLALARIYRDYATYLRVRPADEEDAAWRKAVNG